MRLHALSSPRGEVAIAGWLARIPAGTTDRVRRDERGGRHASEVDCGCRIPEVAVTARDPGWWVTPDPPRQWWDGWIAATSSLAAARAVRALCDTWPAMVARQAGDDPIRGPANPPEAAELLRWAADGWLDDAIRLRPEAAGTGWDPAVSWVAAALQELPAGRAAVLRPEPARRRGAHARVVREGGAWRIETRGPDWTGVLAAPGVVEAAVAAVGSALAWTAGGAGWVGWTLEAERG